MAEMNTVVPINLTRDDDKYVLILDGGIVASLYADTANEAMAQFRHLHPEVMGKGALAYIKLGGQ